MNLLQENIKDVYLKYFFISLGGSLAFPIYGLIDMAMVGNYYGPIGVAVMAIVMPIWTVLFGFGFLTGVGGAVLFSNSKGDSEKSHEANEFFTSAFLCSSLFSLIIWCGLIFYETEILTILGAENELMELAKQYLIPVKILAPVFGYMQLLIAFLRNDSNPALVTKGIFIGGVFNIVGDYLLIFTFDMGMLGAGIATVGGALLSSLYMCKHFISPINTMKLVRPKQFFIKSKDVILTGFPTFFIDVTLGLLTLIFIRQILLHLDANALAIYGIIVNITVCVRCCAFAVGHASQPIISINFGARLLDRVRLLLRYNIITIIIITGIWLFVLYLFPSVFVYLFMTPTDEVLEIAPAIIRTFAIAYIFLPFNVYTTSFTQAILMQKLSMLLSLLNGIILSGLFLLFLPSIFGGYFIWLASPLAELVTAVICAYTIYYTLRKGILAKDAPQN